MKEDAMDYMEMVVFAYARLDEDERDLVKDPPTGLGYANLEARIRREIAFKRAILERYEWLRPLTGPGNQDPAEYELYILPPLVAVWVEHPEYRREWAP